MKIQWQVTPYCIHKMYTTTMIMKKAKKQQQQNHTVWYESNYVPFVQFVPSKPAGQRQT